MCQLVSIIIPIYNCSEYIEETIISCIHQTYENIEIVCVDDGSTDNSLGIVKKILDNSERCYTLIHKENGGVASARNLGLKNAKGTMISFLDADDVLSPYAVEVLMKAAEAERVSAVVGASIYSENCFCFDEKREPVIRGNVELITRPVVWGGYIENRYYLSLMNISKQTKMLSL